MGKKVYKMITKKLWLSMLVIILVFVMTVIGCLKNPEKGSVISEPEIIPVFEITSLRINHLNNIGWRELEVFDPMRLNIGIVTVIVKYDSYATLGIKDTESIRLEGVGNQVFIDKSTIVVEVLDAYVTNYRHVISYPSNPILQEHRYVTPEFIFEIQKDHVVELKELIIESNVANFTLAKENFMLQYELLCVRMGLEVIWAENTEEFNSLIDRAKANLSSLSEN